MKKKTKKKQGELNNKIEIIFLINPNLQNIYIYKMTSKMVNKRK